MVIYWGACVLFHKSLDQFFEDNDRGTGPLVQTHFSLGFVHQCRCPDDACPVLPDFELWWKSWSLSTPRQVGADSWCVNHISSRSTENHQWKLLLALCALLPLTRKTSLPDLPMANTVENIFRGFCIDGSRLIRMCFLRISGLLEKKSRGLCSHLSCVNLPA